MYHSVELYDRYLETQADISFGAELAFFYRPPWTESRSVVDLGCGNGSYLRRLAMQFPDMHFIGVDTDSRLLERARSGGLPENVELICGELWSIRRPVDLLFSRLCTIYIEDLTGVVDWAWRYARLGIIDVGPADSWMWFGPDLPLFEAVVSRGLPTLSSRRGGTRAVAAEFGRVCESKGFRLEWVHDVVVTSAPPYSREGSYRFKLLTAELLLAGQVSTEIRQELAEWFSKGDRSYTQFAHRGHCYVR